MGPRELDLAALNDWLRCWFLRQGYHWRGSSLRRIGLVIELRLNTAGRGMAREALLDENL